ncbi:MAG: hypothetical protein WC479_07255 [Candidatus Izemoplasmatales bacterium]
MEVIRDILQDIKPKLVGTFRGVPVYVSKLMPKGELWFMKRNDVSPPKAITIEEFTKVFNEIAIPLYIKNLNKESPFLKQLTTEAEKGEDSK